VARAMTREHILAHSVSSTRGLSVYMHTTFVTPICVYHLCNTFVNACMHVDIHVCMLVRMWCVYACTHVVCSMHACVANVLLMCC
jgi:hypothetical protein